MFPKFYRPISDEEKNQTFIKLSDKEEDDEVPSCSESLAQSTTIASAAPVLDDYETTNTDEITKENIRKNSDACQNVIREKLELFAEQCVQVRIL